MSDNPLSIGRRTVHTTPGTTPATTTDSAAIRGRLTNPVFSAADAAVASEVRNKLNTGAFDSNPALKARVVNLLATLDAATSNGGVPRVPDRRQISRVLEELRRIQNAASGGTTPATGGNTPATGTTPAGGSEAPFSIGPVANTDPPERIREVRVAWDYGEVTPDLAGFRLYHEGEMVCESRSPTARSMSCEVSLSEGAHNFTLTAFNQAGLESAHSNTAVLNNVFPPE